MDGLDVVEDFKKIRRIVGYMPGRFSLYQDLSVDYPRVQEIPFDSVRKRMTTIHKVLDPQTEDFSPFKTDDTHKDWYVVAVKGAPDVMLDLCQQYQTYDDKQAELIESVHERIRVANDKMAGKALRVKHGLSVRLRLGRGADAVDVLLRADDQQSVRDRRRAHDDLAHLVLGQLLVLLAGADDDHLALLVREVEPAVLLHADFVLVL